MPLIKSAIKRTRVIKRKTLVNQRIKTKTKALVKEFESFIKDKKIADATKILPNLFKAFDNMAKKNIWHPNKTNRQKSNAAKKVATK